MKVKGTPDSYLDPVKADVNLYMGRFTLWLGGTAGTCIVRQGDHNYNTGKPWTQEDLVRLADDINSLAYRLCDCDKEPGEQDKVPETVVGGLVKWARWMFVGR